MTILNSHETILIISQGLERALQGPREWLERYRQASERTAILREHTECREMNSQLPIDRLW